MNQQKLIQKFYSLLGCAAILSLTACTADILETEQSPLTRSAATSGEMQRMVFHSRPQLKQAIIASEKGSAQTRLATQEFSDGAIPFVSYFDYRKAEALAKIPSQSRSASADENIGMTTIFRDPVVNDAPFARLLNANAEIQMGDTVYRYCRQGVAYANLGNSAELQKLDSLVAANPDVANALVPVSLGENLTFIPIVKTTSINDGDDTEKGEPTDEADDSDSGLGSGQGDYISRVRGSIVSNKNGIWIYDSEYNRGINNLLTSIQPYNIRKKTVSIESENWISGNLENVGWVYKYGAIQPSSFYPGYKLQLWAYSSNWIICSTFGFRTEATVQDRTSAAVSLTALGIGWEALVFEHKFDSKVEILNPFYNLEPCTPNSAEFDVVRHENDSIVNAPFFLSRAGSYSFADNAGEDIGVEFDKAYRNSYPLTYEENQAGIQCGGKPALYSIENKTQRTIFGPESIIDDNISTYAYQFSPQYMLGQYYYGFDYNGQFTYMPTGGAIPISATCKAGVIYAVARLNQEWLAAKIVITPKQ